MTTLREAAQQALEALEDYKYAEARDALRAALAEPVLQTCNCRWDGEVQVQQRLREVNGDESMAWADE